MLQPELKFRRDKIRYLMAQQGIDAALIACNVNLLYTYGEIVNEIGRASCRERVSSPV